MSPFFIVHKIFFWVSGILLFAAWSSNDLYPPWIKAQSQFLAFAALLCIYPPLILGNARCFSLVSIRVILIAIGISIVLTLQVAMDSDRLYWGDAFIWSAFLLGGALAFAAGRRIQVLWRVDSTIVNVCLLTTASAFLSGLLAINQWLEIWDFGYWTNHIPFGDRATANFGQANHLAIHAACGVAAVIGLFQAKKIHAATSALLLLVMFFAIILSTSRIGLYSAIAICIFFSCFVSKNEKNVRILCAVSAVTVFCLYLLYPSMSAALDILPSRPVRLMHTNGRWEIYQQFFQILLQSPISGNGPGGIVISQFAFASTGAPASLSMWSHNVFLDMLLVLGIPMGAVLIVTSIYAIYRAAKNALQHKQLVAFALAIPVLMGSLTEFPYAYAYLLLPAVFCLGLIKYAPTEGAENDSKAVKATQFSIWLACVVLLFSTSKEYLAIEEDFRMARFESGNIGTTPESYVRPNILYFDQLAALLNQVRRKPHENMSNAELKAMEKSMRRFPFSISMLRYAKSLAMNGRLDEIPPIARAAGSFHGQSAKNKIEFEVEYTLKNMPTK